MVDEHDLVGYAVTASAACALSFISMTVGNVSCVHDRRGCARLPGVIRARDLREAVCGSGGTQILVHSDLQLASHQAPWALTVLLMNAQATTTIAVRTALRMLTPR
jgi:hypothetical protein